MSLEDDSLEGSIIVRETPVIKEPKSIYKSGIDHRFFTNPEKKFVADKPLLNLFKKNTWRTVADIVKETGLSERTVQYVCRRFIKHEIFEESNVTKVGVYHKYKNRHPVTRLYRLIAKSKNGTRKNPRKYENHKKRQSRSNR